MPKTKITPEIADQRLRDHLMEHSRGHIGDAQAFAWLIGFIMQRDPSVVVAAIEARERSIARNAH